ncbi:hypothetical protein BSKO_11135 [Bryopsis sp. KO-2023]|nr:hypothetical protein BSKO_11135 [Bryopsis sp. KO-2023]
MQATPPKAKELPILAPLQPEPLVMEKPHPGESTQPHRCDARNLFRGDSALLWNRPNDAVSIDMDSASSLYATLPPDHGDSTQMWAPPPGWQGATAFPPGFQFMGQSSRGVFPQPSSSRDFVNQAPDCRESNAILTFGAEPEPGVKHRSKPPRRRLDELPMELLVVVLQTVSVASVVSVVNLAATCRTCYQASQVLLRDDPSVSRSVRQNQRIYQEIRAQLVKEDRGRRWPRSRLTSRWVREDGSPSPLKVLCEWPEVFPYFPSVVCFAFATFVICFSLVRLATAELASTQVMLGQLAGYGVIVECIAAVCGGYFFVSYAFFLRSLSVLFNLLIVFQWAIGLLGGVLFFITGMQVVYMWVCIAFTFATWMTMKHCGSEFRPGYWKTNAIGSLVFSSFSVIYFLLYTPDGTEPP